MERWEGDSVLSIGKKRKSFHIVPGWHRVQLRTPYHNRSPRLFGWVRGYRNKISGNDFYGNLPCDLSRGTRIYIHIHSPLQTGVVVQPPRPISNSKKKKEKSNFHWSASGSFLCLVPARHHFPVCMSITIMYSTAAAQAHRAGLWEKK